MLQAKSALLITSIIILIAQSIVVIYTCATDGTPFRGELLTPWLSATLIDFYFNVLILSIWVFYREDSYIMKIFWIAFLVCLGSIGTAAYIIYLLLTNNREKGFPATILVNKRDYSKLNDSI